MNNYFKWRLLMSLIPLGFAALMLSSCSTDDAPSVASEHVTVLSRSNSDSNIIDAAAAEHVAVKFSTIPVDGVERAAKSVSNIVTINNANGIPVMYAVNFAENDGYVIVSASKATSPIVAFSDRGSYKSNQTSLHTHKVLEKLCDKITETFGYSQDSVVAHRCEWSSYLPMETTMRLKLKASSSSESYAIIANVVEQWIQMGYEVCPVQQWYPGGWPMYRELGGLDNMLQRLTMPVNWADGIPANQLCFIVIQTTEAIYDSTNKCAPLTTRWSTDAPFNSAVPDGMMLSPEAVALGQMLHYYKDPSIMVHSRAESNPLQDNTEVSNFLYEVARNVNTVFGTMSSHSSIDDVTNALSNLYSYDFIKSQPSEQAFVSSIDKGSPVMVVGYDAQGNSDSWICSRYQRRDVSRKYMLMAPLGQPGGIFGPYESCAAWDNNGGANFYFDNSKDEIYFCSWADFWTFGQLRTDKIVFFGDIFKKPWEPK